MNAGDPAALPLDELLKIDSACDRYEAAWKSGRRPDQGEYLSGFHGESRHTLLQHLEGIDAEYATIDLAEFLRRLNEEQLDPGSAFDSDAKDAKTLAESMVAGGQLTRYQADVLLSQFPHPLLLDDYRILEQIGSGGMGTVYRALHRRMNRIVAVKVVRARASELERQGKWFRREVEVAGRLMHPNIVTAFDAGEARDIAYLVSEFVDGTDLRTRVANRGPMDWREACAVIREAAHGLDHAHRSGVVHRDVKPSNIMLDRNGLVRVLDVGLARNLAADAPARESSYDVVGTPEFMAPEQLAAPADADARADIYALGSTLYFLLAGKAPFDKSTAMDWIAGKPDMVVPSLRSTCPQAPGTLVVLFDILMQREPDSRPQSMSEVMTALDRILTPARSRWPWIAGACVLLLAGTVVFWKPARKPDPTPTPIPAKVLPELAAIPFDPHQLQSAWANALDWPQEIEPVPGLKARLIPPGKFADAEVPAFYLGTTEVTTAMFRRFVESQSPPYVTVAERHDGYALDASRTWRRTPGTSWRKAGEQPLTDDHPVCNLCRDDCADFCQWLASVTANRYLCRLPTETEWEWACRAGSPDPWSSGPHIADLNSAAWYAGTIEPSDARIRAVGRKSANGFGLFDMHGNLAEWCAGTFDGDHGVVRGGNIRATGEGVACSARELKSLTDPVGGFRVLLIPIRTP